MTNSLPGGRKPEVVICTYRIKKGEDAAFLKKLERHWPTLKRQGLVTGKASVVYRGIDESKKTFFCGDFYLEGRCCGGGA